ncbi:MAG TPA: DUF5994 family protein [Actinophytocola sp.]|uniref:DUF5994 family protein n=1 Tax=Actinophytocola sp. TaxID=1872138 RepID=UPI002DB95471|nr:DUF5994 family protein [Actinophytocola sp.]HEU5475476.1 DUF5994 family protein [Actinophytocola sp.]
MAIPTRTASQPVERTDRVCLKPDGPPTGYVDGAWWPGSRALPTELVPLLAMLTARLGRVERVTYNLTIWEPAPRRLALDGRVVRLGGFRSQPADTVTVIGRGGQQRLTLLVIPPGTDPATAERVLARASQPGNAETIETLLAPTRVAGTGAGIGGSNGSSSAVQRWESDGGRLRDRA